ncbi:hypothetical protein MGI18_00940 [Bacillus sp. OVS6]|nr:hypothetical protein MGI18_00940 [Bacillus sp. OVS6]
MMKTSVWNQLKSYQSTETVQKFLEKSYKKISKQHLQNYPIKTAILSFTI